MTRTIKDAHEAPELRAFIAPALCQWCATRRNLAVLELGPAYTTVVPETLLPVLDSYTAADFSEPYLRKQREFLTETPELLKRTTQVVADTYELSLPDASFDLIVVSCHPPLVSATVKDKCMVIEKMHALLKSNGVLALFPWYFGEQPLEVSRKLLSRFRLRRMVDRNGKWRRLLLLLEKR